MPETRHAAELRDGQARSTAGQSAITGYTKELGAQLAGVPGQIGQAYGQATSGQAASDAALSQKLSGGGGALADELARKLGAAGQVTAPADQARDIGTAAGGTSYAQGVLLVVQADPPGNGFERV